MQGKMRCNSWYVVLLWLESKGKCSPRPHRDLARSLFFTLHVEKGIQYPHNGVHPIHPYHATTTQLPEAHMNLPAKGLDRL